MYIYSIEFRVRILTIKLALTPLVCMFCMLMRITRAVVGNPTNDPFACGCVFVFEANPSN